MKTTRTGLLTDRNDHVLVALDRLVEQLREERIDAELVTGRTPVGAAHRTILELAEKAGVDLLVVGNCGHCPLAGPFLGSVAVRLIQSAPFPVLMVPSGRDRAEIKGQYRDSGSGRPLTGRRRPSGEHSTTSRNTTSSPKSEEKELA